VERFPVLSALSPEAPGDERTSASPAAGEKTASDGGAGTGAYNHQRFDDRDRRWEIR